VIDCLDFTKAPPGYAEWQPWQSGRPVDDRVAWSHYKTHNDPPGLRTRPWGLGSWVFHCCLVVDPQPGPRTVMVNDDDHPYANQAEARAASWIWYERRLAAVQKAEDDPRFRIDHCASCGWENPPQIEDECLECGSTDCLITTWGEGQAERYRTGERYSTPQGECEQEEGPNIWPRCLTWSDAQLEAVEQWLKNPDADLPEVLHEG
jgi:hypothetical protein